jgi:hypothetical protein
MLRRIFNRFAVSEERLFAHFCAETTLLAGAQGSRSCNCKNREGKLMLLLPETTSHDQQRT